jgi:hypothetical protein
MNEALLEGIPVTSPTRGEKLADKINRIAFNIAYYPCLIAVAITAGVARGIRDAFKRYAE